MYKLMQHRTKRTLFYMTFLLFLDALDVHRRKVLSGLGRLQNISLYFNILQFINSIIFKVLFTQRIPQAELVLSDF